jgi:hypothetical protein
MRQQTQIQGQQRVPEARQAGFIAIVASGFFTFKIAPWLARVVEDFMISQGINAGFSIAEIGAVLAVWLYGAQFLQFLIDEYILIPFYQDKAIRDMKRLSRKLEDKGSAKKRYGWALAILFICYLYLGK